MNNAYKLPQIWRKYNPVKSIRLFSTELDMSEFVNEETQRFEKSFNEVRLLGRVGKDPVLVNSEGKSYAKFSFATNVVWKSDDGEPKVKTDWHNIITHEPKLVDYVKNYVKKGQRLHLSGRLSYIVPENNPQGKVAIIALNDIISLAPSYK